MDTNLRRWRVLAILLMVVNFGGLIMALGAGEPTHAMGHVVVGIGLMAWNRRLRERLREAGEDSVGASDRQSQLEGLESEMDQLRRELTETQERLDFTERMLARREVTPR